jgi:hypothetical protein
LPGRSEAFIIIAMSNWNGKIDEQLTLSLPLNRQSAIEIKNLKVHQKILERKEFLP